MAGEDSNPLVVQFMEITGADIATAQFSLEATAFDLETAIDLHMSSGGGGGTSFTSAAGGGGGGVHAAGTNISGDRAVGTKAAALEADMDWPSEEDGVRRADEVKRQRLLDYQHGYRHDAALPRSVKNSVFFGGSGGDNLSSAAAGGDKLQGKMKKLNDMFAPPHDIMTKEPLLAAAQRLYVFRSIVLPAFLVCDVSVCLSLIYLLLPACIL
jgi:hypothetical protein